MSRNASDFDDSRASTPSAASTDSGFIANPGIDLNLRASRGVGIAHFMHYASCHCHRRAPVQFTGSSECNRPQASCNNLTKSSDSSSTALEIPSQHRSAEEQGVASAGGIVDKMMDDGSDSDRPALHECHRIDVPTTESCAERSAGINADTNAAATMIAQSKDNTSVPGSQVTGRETAMVETEPLQTLFRELLLERLGSSGDPARDERQNLILAPIIEKVVEDWYPRLSQTSLGEYLWLLYRAIDEAEEALAASNRTAFNEQRCCMSRS